MTREEKLWRIVSQLTFNELSKISHYVMGSARERFDSNELDIYKSHEFASMLADYAEAKLEEFENDI